MHGPFDAAVVGSGPNGLCAAIRLAQAGLSVVVYEARDHVGGGATTAQLTLPGFHHDVCSSIHPMAVGTPFLPSLPLERHGLRWVHPSAPLAHPFEDGSAVLLERDLDAHAAGLPVDGPAWSSWMRTYVERWDDLVRDGVGPLQVPRSPILLARFGLHAALPADRLAQAMFKTPEARALFGGLAAHSLLRLDRLMSSAIGVMLGAAGHAVGWPMPEGGAQSLSNALAEHFLSLGGTIHTSRPIAHLDEVETAGPVLLEVAPPALARIAGDHLPAGFLRQLQTYRFGLGSFKVDWALSEPIPWKNPEVARAATVHLGGHLEGLVAGERAAWRGELVDEPFVLLGQNSLFDPTRAPEGRHTAWAYHHVPPGCTADRTEVIEAAVERYAPGFRDTILARHTLSPADLEAHCPNFVGGDINAGAADLTQIFFRPSWRLAPHTTPNPRLFLCSASTPPGGGIHGMCGVFAAQEALKRWR
jgi:phytoene dehydrogenase-like protein